VAAATTWEYPGIAAAETKSAASDSLTNCLKTMPHLLCSSGTKNGSPMASDVFENAQNKIF
jgi:hypothetical protein